MKKFLTVAVFLLTIGFGRNIYGKEMPKLIIDGKDSGLMIQIKKDRIMVPIREIGERKGFIVTWNGALKTARLEKGDNLVVINFKNNSMTVNGSLRKINDEALIIDDKTYVGARFISEWIGENIKWDKKNNMAIMNTIDLDKLDGDIIRSQNGTLKIKLPQDVMAKIKISYIVRDNGKELIYVNDKKNDDLILHVQNKDIIDGDFVIVDMKDDMYETIAFSNIENPVLDRIKEFYMDGLKVEKQSSFSYLNKFAFKSFLDNIKENDDENLVYSPYSYACALNELTKITNGFKNNGFISEFYRHDMNDLRLYDIKSKSEIIANSAYHDLGKVKRHNVKLLDFPNEAAEESRALQKEVLDKVLLEPDYKKDTSIVILNAAKFQGKWEEPFSKNLTLNKTFNYFRGTTKEIPMMNGSINRGLVMEDELASSIFKKVENNGRESKVYFILPKKSGKEEYLKVAERLGRYIGEDKNYFKFDEVYISIPKLDIKSEIDLLEVSNKSKLGLEKPFNLDRNVLVSKMKTTQKISGIKQAATLLMNEEEVKAEAVTEIEARMTSAPTLTTYNFELNRPYFVAITSNDGNGEIVTFMAKVVKPE